jgi:hypothetical protein
LFTYFRYHEIQAKQKKYTVKDAEARFQRRKQEQQQKAQELKSEETVTVPSPSFKANPVPESVKVPMYKDIQKKEKHRKVNPTSLYFSTYLSLAKDH